MCCARAMHRMQQRRQEAEVRSWCTALRACCSEVLRQRDDPDWRDHSKGLCMQLDNTGSNSCPHAPPPSFIPPPCLYVPVCVCTPASRYACDFSLPPHPPTFPPRYNTAARNPTPSAGLLLLNDAEQGGGQAPQAAQQHEGAVAKVGLGGVPQQGMQPPEGLS